MRDRCTSSLAAIGLVHIHLPAQRWISWSHCPKHTDATQMQITRCIPVPSPTLVPLASVKSTFKVYADGLVSSNVDLIGCISLATGPGLYFTSETAKLGPFYIKVYSAPHCSSPKHYLVWDLGTPLVLKSYRGLPWACAVCWNGCLWKRPFCWRSAHFACAGGKMTLG